MVVGLVNEPCREKQMPYPLHPVLTPPGCSSMDPSLRVRRRQELPTRAPPSEHPAARGPTAQAPLDVHTPTHMPSHGPLPRIHWGPTFSPPEGHCLKGHEPPPLGNHAQWASSDPSACLLPASLTGAPPHWACPPLSSLREPKVRTSYSCSCPTYHIRGTRTSGCVSSPWMRGSRPGRARIPGSRTAA